MRPYLQLSYSKRERLREQTEMTTATWHEIRLQDKATGERIHAESGKPFITFEKGIDQDDANSRACGRTFPGHDLYGFLVVID